MYNTLAAHVFFGAVLTVLAVPLYGFAGDCFCKLAGLGCLLYGSYLLASLVDYFLPRFRVTSAKKAVFVTGCDRGFGQLIAQRLDSLGFKVFAGCLDPSSRDVKNLRNTVTSHLVTLKLDVTSDESVREAAEFVKRSLGDHKLWAVVNNAGVIERGELEWTPLDVYKKQFEVNTFGVVRVTQAFLPLLRKSQGRVVTVTSVGGRHTFSGFVPYCMSKHATTSFCDGLRLEMKKFDVKVVTIEPFSYQTNMTDMETVLRSIQATWSRSSRWRDEVYENDYLEAFSSSVRRFNETTALPDTSRVVDLLVEGVCAISPHYSYVAGDARSLLLLWLSRKGPKTLVDYFVRTQVTFDCDVEAWLLRQRADKKDS